MKKSFLLIFINILSISVYSQSIVYGLYTDSNSPYFNYSILATIDAASGTVIEKDTISGYEAVVLGSSSFDQLSGNYIYLAAGNDGIDLLSRNVFDNMTVAAVQPSMNANALQFDMSTGNTYGLGYYIMDSILTDPDMGWHEYIYGTTFVSLDVLSGDVEIIGLLPEVSAVVVGASCFDPNNGMFYFIGISQDHQTKLYGVDASAGTLDVDMTMDLAANEYLNELEYDIDGDVFYAIHRNNTGVMHFAQIDPDDGTIYNLLEITSYFQYFTPDASVYQQDTDEFIMLTVSPNSLLTIDVDNAEVISQAYIDYNVIELEVDNVEFATVQFLSVEEYNQFSFTISPNPAADFITISGIDTNSAQYRILDISGRQVEIGRLGTQNVLSISELKEGAYILELIRDDSITAVKFLVQR